MINASTGNIRIMNSIEMLSWSLTFFLLSAPRTDPTIGIPYDPYRRGAVSLRRARWPDQRRADGLGHAEGRPPRLASTDRLQGLIHCAKRRREVLRFVGGPHVAGGPMPTSTCNCGRHRRSLRAERSNRRSSPGGQFSVRKPRNSTIPSEAVDRLETQMLSLPSTDTAQG